jgi:FKBP-type peptidyl-prolyl cis-trans isomerase FkpA
VKIFLACVALALATIGCNSDDGGNPTDPSQVNIEFTTTDISVGTGAQAAVGNAVTVNYTGWLYNAQGTDSKGAQFDTSIGKTPLGPFTLGARSIIVGFEQAVVGMRVGGKRRAYIPASLAYGSQGNGPIPPNAAIVFEIDLLTVQ